MNRKPAFRQLKTAPNPRKTALRPAETALKAPQNTPAPAVPALQRDATAPHLPHTVLAQ